MNQKSAANESTRSVGSSSVGYGSGSLSEAAKGTKDLAADVGREVRRDAGGLVEEAKHTLDAQVSTFKARAVDQIDGVADAIRHTGEHLRSQDAGVISEYVEGAANRVELVSAYLRSRSLRDMTSDVERLARREPALFLGGAFVAGLLGGRFLKSSAPERSQRGKRSGESAGTAPAGAARKLEMRGSSGAGPQVEPEPEETTATRARPAGAATPASATPGTANQGTASQGTDNQGTAGSAQNKTGQGAASGGTPQKSERTA